MNTALILFAIAAAGGIVMAAMRLTGRPTPPFALAIVHGIFAAAGLVTLIVAVAGGSRGLAVTALIGFIIAALGGLYLLLFFHLKRSALPIPVMLIHAAVAVISFILLLVGILRSA
jgi:hypothetical protein